MGFGSNNYLNHADTTRKSSRTQQKKKVKADKKTRNNVQYSTSGSMLTKDAVEGPANEIGKTIPNEPCKDVLVLLETGEISFFKNKDTRYLCPLVKARLKYAQSYYC